MLVKLNQKNKLGQDLYQVVYVSKLTNGCAKTFGPAGTLDQLKEYNMPSMRHSERHPDDEKPKIRSNRKFTIGRQMFFVPQPIKDKNGKIVGHSNHMVKHFQETNDALSRKAALVEFNEKILTAKGKFYSKHPELRAGNKL